MIILVLNCGSSSIKYQLFDMEGEAKILAKGLVERIGISGSALTHKPVGKDPYKVENIDIPDHTVGIDLVMKALCDPVHGVIKDVNEIDAVGHRVLNGGTYGESVLVDDNVIKEIKDCIPIVPLHNPGALKGILSARELMPNTPQVSVFDTSFHQTMPDYAYMYALPYEYYGKYKMRKYGYHGTSHKFVSRKAAEILGKDVKELKTITCHLGNGASIAAVKYGKVIDTSMGFTPTDGLYMGTRVGTIDPGAVNYIAEKENLSPREVETLIMKQSGMLGVSGVSSDMRDLDVAASEGNERAILALKMYAYRVKSYIGSYFAAMNGLDVVLFTGGIGENDYKMRSMVCKDRENLGIIFDEEANYGVRGKDVILSKPESKVTVMCVTTDEELLIATDTKAIVEKL
ncbi:MAG: acetate kinase [Bacteroidales bacterium]|nr:acetate kinase [Bacteroidales bacterium]